ncbi:urate hydroxylase PuuD [Pelagovum pacificum]|uniref:Urate hydroxylase PuuD n=1 Tax=Pelagovum pacificum TaxID=2588711 RepID=A0A5C5G934_9RHOB|nr:urate hydroxylase PuuD [Pelagovum pacificum]QQA42148.1 urate hydroxylase PuuD [Pelagovum pacificum]TNY31236.1 urate hydroxylase PuuD [Pelagovum pacificum]
MFDWAFAMHWVEFAVRWVHVITAIAWIGSSFYFIALDLGLNRNIPGPADGEEWQVHGGGFYHIQKYLVAPENLPEHLTWFKWESYATWLSGFAMLCLVYYIGGDLYLVDPEVADLAVWQAVIISLLSLGLGWVMYDLICKSKFGEDNTRLMIGLYVILVIMAWGYTQVFSGRAALLHLGAFTATIMSANVFLIIIPNQKIVVADLKAGRTPDSKYGKIAKQRSTHNNYLTLPVLFLMLSNHYPMAFASEWNWIIAALVFLMGVTIRHFFNTMHARGEMLWWTWAVTAALFVLIVWFSWPPADSWEDETAMTRAGERFAAADGFDEVHDIVNGHCTMCHNAEPGLEAIPVAPRGVKFENAAQIANQARRIYLQAGLSDAMPPPRHSYMTVEDRAAIVRWYRAGQGS